MVECKKELTFRNRNYPILRGKNCKKCVPQFVLFCAFAFRKTFSRTTPLVFTFVLRILQHVGLGVHKTIRRILPTVVVAT